MTVQDFLAMMELNKEVYPEFAALTDEQKRYLAWVNVESGTADAYIENGELVGVGGIRFVGIGEGWLITSPGMRKDRKFTLLKEAKKSFIATRDRLNLWRIFATSKISQNFLKHLGFESENTTHIWTKKA